MLANQLSFITLILIQRIYFIILVMFFLEFFGQNSYLKSVLIKKIKWLTDISRKKRILHRNKEYWNRWKSFIYVHTLLTVIKLKTDIFFTFRDERWKFVAWDQVYFQAEQEETLGRYFLRLCLVCSVPFLIIISFIFLKGFL